MFTQLILTGQNDVVLKTQHGCVVRYMEHLHALVFLLLDHFDINVLHP